MVKRGLKETVFEDGDIMIYDEESENTYILNSTAKIVYDYLKDNYVSEDDLFLKITKDYEGFPIEYFQEIIEKLKKFGIIK